MAVTLSELRDELLKVSSELNDERDRNANDPAKVAVAEAEFDRIAVILATIQEVINTNQELEMNRVAARLEQSIQSQRAVGLSLARTRLERLLPRFRDGEGGGTSGGSVSPPSQEGEAEEPQADLLERLVAAYKRATIRHPQLRAVTLAQWMLESGRATSKLATLHLNFGGLKFRPEMAPFATKISFEAHDGVDDYCKFSTVENFIDGYWAFLDRSPYAGWENHAGSGESFIRFIGPVYTPTPGYANKVLGLVSEADALLSETGAQPAESSRGGAINLGTIVIDPGHGGTHDEAGSSFNNATAKSGVLEKTLTLDFALRLKTALMNQANEAGEAVKVVLTRSTDENLPGLKRARTAFDHKAKLFLSIHFNGLGREEVRGTETFYRAGESNLNLAQDKAFAQDVQDAVFNAIRALDPGAVNRGIKPDTDSGPGGIGVLSDERLGNDRRSERCCAALLEIEFISNPAADRLLVSGPNAAANRTTVMAALARGLRKHLKTMTPGVDLVA